MFVSSASCFYKRLFRYLSFARKADNEFIFCYVGEPLEKIIGKHPDHALSRPDDSAVLIFETRLKDSTLSCEIREGVCVDARLFRDRETVAGSACFQDYSSN